MTISQARTVLVTAAITLAACHGAQPPEPGPQTPMPAAARAAPTGALTTAADAKLRERLLALFAGYEHIVTKDELVPLAEPAQLIPALEAIYRDPSVHPTTRVNALASLRFFPSPAVKTIYEQVLTAPDTADDARRSAVKAYGVGFGVEAVPLLSKLLQHPELHTRDTAAKSLGAIGDESAVVALRQHLPQEQAPLVKASIEDVLAKIDPRPDGKKANRSPKP